MADTTETILRDYPSFAYLLNDPEIGPLLLEAIDPDKGFDAATFQAKIMQTNWWKTSSASQRQWETLVATDPATAQQQQATWRDTLRVEATKAGITLNDGQLDWFQNFYLPRGVAANDPQIVRDIARLYQDQPAIRTGVGDIDTVKNQMQDIAAQYLRDLTQADYDQWATKIASGETDLNSFQTMVRNQARTEWPFYQEEINAGVTPAQLFSQQRNAIANELERDPSSIDLVHDPVFSQVLGVPDKDGRMRPMTRSEAIVLARKQDAWRNTSAARQQSADLVTTLGQTFGVLA